MMTNEPRITEKVKSYYTGNFSNKVLFKNPFDEREWARTQVRECSKCKVSKPRSVFAYNTSGSDPFEKTGHQLRRPECMECTRACRKSYSAAKNVAKRMGMSTTAPIGTACQLCDRTDQKLVFDHCHSRDKFRGWLCNRCNTTLGIIQQHNADFLDRIRDYLLCNST